MKHTYHELKKAIDAYIGLITGQMQEALWTGGVRPRDEYLVGDTSNYHLIGEQEISSHDVQFMHKVDLPVGARVAVVGDLHGDKEALDEILTKLEQLSLFDKATGKLLENCYLACVGDYVNRYAGSIEVVKLLCSLALKNPGRILLTRGNHEYALTNKFFRIRFELAKARGEDYPADTCMLDELKEACVDYTYPDLLYWYDYLPAAVFLGFQSETSGKKNYVQICHAGLELGWSPHQLLKMQEVTFEWVTRIDRQAALERLDKHPILRTWHSELKKVVALLFKQEYEHFAQLYDEPKPLDLTSPVSPFHSRFGWQWNNFLAEDNKEPMIAASGVRRNLFFDRVLTKHLFEEASSEYAELVSLMRGHQHCDDVIEEQKVSSHFLADIRRKKGMIRQWDGMVYTLGATKGVSHCYSFALLDTGFVDNQEMVTHWYKEVGPGNEWISSEKELTG